MEVKTFEGFDLKAALKLVKSEFGNDAIILKTQEKFDSQFGRKVFEITATANSHHRPLDGAVRFDDQSNNLAERLESIESRLTMMGEYLPKRSHLMGIESGIDEMRKMLLSSLQSRNEQSIKDVDHRFLGLFNRLSLASIDTFVIGDLLNHLSMHFKDFVPMEDVINAAAMKWMLKQISTAERWNLKKGFVQIQCFVGRGGVGKTTLLAKIAAASRKKHKTLIVAYANSKIGGNEQLKVLSKILECKFIEISRPAELSDFLLQHGDYELVLVDTDFTSLKDASNTRRICELRDFNLPVGMNLVLSSCEKSDVTDATMKYFSEVSIDTLNFTYVEDLASFGEIFNRSSKWQVPIQYLSIGDRIPEDIERANKEKIIQRLLGF